MKNSIAGSIYQCPVRDIPGIFQVYLDGISRSEYSRDIPGISRRDIPIRISQEYPVAYWVHLGGIFLLFRAWQHCRQSIDLCGQRTTFQKFKHLKFNPNAGPTGKSVPLNTCLGNNVPWTLLSRQMCPL